MKALLLIFTFSLLLQAHNPKVYSALGDIIYDNVNKIDNLKSIKGYAPFSSKIDKYVKDVAALKKMGFNLESGDKSIDKNEYLSQLREFSKTNDFFVRSANSYLDSAIKSENSELFLKIVNNGLVDIKKHKEEIVSYYLSHVNEIDATGTIQTILNQNGLLKRQKEAKQQYYKRKQALQKEKIKRIRENDKAKQEALEKKLQDEFDKKKSDIKKYKEKELAR